MHWFIAYIVCLVSFLAIDLAFIGGFATKIYRQDLGKLINDKPKLLPGIQLYVIYIGAILLYGVWPLLHFFGSAPASANLLKILLWGGGLGLTAYGVYAFTAQSLVRGWKYRVVYIDVLWGAVITAIVTLIGYAIVS